MPSAASDSHSSGSRVSPTPGRGGGGTYVTVLLIDQLPLEVGDESFEMLSWGGGNHFLLAAASQQHIYFFSLQVWAQTQTASASYPSSAALHHTPCLTMSGAPQHTAVLRAPSIPFSTTPHTALL